MFAEVVLPLPPDHPFTYRVPEELAGQIRTGHSVLVPFHRRTLRGVVVQLKGESGLKLPRGDSGIREIRSILNPLQPVPEPLIRLAGWIGKNYGTSWGESLSVVFSWSRRFRELPGGAVFRAPPDAGESHTLTADQEDAVRAVQSAVRSRGYKAFLLFGVTSSGKTEVYIRAIEAALAAKRQALFLVPEISLCQPFVDLLGRRFGGRVGFWHSQMGAREKKQQLDAIRLGKIDVLIGARSALFAPFADVGVIVVDEEHDFSYKQDEKPRYHAREAAGALARIHGAALILGSATPSVETFWRARQGELEILRLPERVPSHSVPDITLVDRRRAAKEKSSLTPDLAQAMAVSLARREQAILALNRRGLATFLLCPGCGFIWKCAGCSLALVIHESDGGGKALKCHYCFHSEGWPAKCAACGSEAFLSGGFGTQKVVKDVQARFSFARVVRLDRDVSNRKAAAQTYRLFREESADVLVGTQMATQGFDFPRVTLVGIVDADTALHHPDFRSGEKTFQWITQAAGRAGRSSLGGRVIVQTVMPDHYALESAARQDYESFFAREIEFRRALAYPPFSRLVLFRLESGGRREVLMEEAERLAALLRGKLPADAVRILGPGPSPKERLKKKLRWQILLKCLDPAAAPAAAQLGRSFVPKSGIRLVVDVDPYYIL